MNSDAVNYNIDGLIRSIEELKEINESMIRSQNNFLNHIEGPLSNNWSTPGGKMAINHLRDFARNDFQNYINYLNSKIYDFESVVVPALKKMDQA